MSGGPPDGLEAPGEEYVGNGDGPWGAAPAGGQPANSGGTSRTQPPAEPPAPGEQPEHEDGQEYWFSEDDGDEADWQDAADDEDLDADDDEEMEAWDDEFGDEEDFSDDDEPLDEWDDEGSESSDAPEAEEAARERLEADTAGRFVCPGWAAYPIPTTSHHFQSADALALSEAAGPRGGLLAATFDVHGVTVWLLPAGGDIAALGLNQPAIRLGGFQAPRDAYSLAFSPDGRWLATGAEGGLLTLYSVDPTAPPRPQLPPGRLPLLQGLNYFYTPLLLPQQLRLRQQQEAQAQARAAGGSTAPGGAQAAAPAAAAAALPPPAQPCGQLPGLVPGLAPNTVDRRAVQMLDLAIDAVQRRLQAEAAEDGDSPRQCQLRQVAVSDEVEQNRGFLRAVMGQDMLMLRELLPPPAAGGHPAEPPVVELGDLGVMEHEVAASYRSFMYRAGAAVQLLQTIGRQRKAAGPGTASSAAAETPAGAVLEAAVAPAGDAATRQDQQADQQGKAAGKRPLAAGQAADAAAWRQQHPAQHRSQPAQQQGVPQAAAVQLRGILAVGMEQEQARRVPFLSDGMLNGVRFGMVAGKQRLLAADQSGYVYVFELPSSAAAAAEAGSSSASSAGSASSELRAEQLLCPGLGEPSQHWRMRPVNFFRAIQHPLGARVQQQQPAEAPRPGQREGTRAAARAAAAAAARAEGAAAGTAAAGDGSGLFLTAALGPFPTACNLAAASPDGRWIAAVGDAQAVYLADQSAGFAWRPLPFDLAGSRADVEQGLDAGSQYCAWNASSSLLAASSDALHAVFVWEPRSGQLVMRVEGHAKPCLSLGFAPWNDRLLVYAEESRRIHLRGVPSVDPTAGGGSGGSGPAGEAGSGSGAAEGPHCGAALCEQNARDDLADARGGVQLLQLPIVPSVPPPPGPLASVQAMQAQLQMGGRRRRVTGMALSRGGDLLATTRQGTLLRYLSSQPWQPEQHRLWPAGFRAAVATLLLCAHRQQRLAGQAPGQQAAGLWLLPLPVLQLVIAAAAGQRSDWLPQPAADAAGVAAPQARTAAQQGAAVSSAQEEAS